MKNLRTWIADLESANELIRIDKPVDPLTQMGSLLYQSRDKALFFDTVNGRGWVYRFEANGHSEAEAA